MGRFQPISDPSRTQRAAPPKTKTSMQQHGTRLSHLVPRRVEVHEKELSLCVRARGGVLPGGCLPLWAAPAVLLRV